MKSIVLLSGGLDSTVNLHWAHKEGTVALALTFDYGQRAASAETKASAFFCRHLKIPHQVIDLPWLQAITQTALVETRHSLPHLADLDDPQEATRSAKAVWVPNRNGVFLNIAASFAESLGADAIIPGFNREEAATFPDNSEAYLRVATDSLALSTLSQVKVHCFTLGFDKAAMVAKALELGVALEHVWSCYRAGPKACGRCESCQRFQRAKRAAGVL